MPWAYASQTQVAVFLFLPAPSLSHTLYNIAAHVHLVSPDSFVECPKSFRICTPPALGNVHLLLWWSLGFLLGPIKGKMCTVVPEENLGAEEFTGCMIITTFGQCKVPQDRDCLFPNQQGKALPYSGV